MPAQSKPGVDWREVEVGYRAGVSLGKLAARHGVSRQGITKRARREGWEREAATAPLAETRTAERLLRPETPADHRIIADGKRTLANMQRVLDSLRLGVPRSTAARVVGISDVTLRAWFEDDPAFARQADAAEADTTLRRLTRLEAAGERGDAATDRWLLERSPQTRDDFGARPLGLVPGGATVTINLHLAPEFTALLAQPAAVAPLVIEVGGEDVTDDDWAAAAADSTEGTSA